MSRYVHMHRITEPEHSCAFYEALGFEFRRYLEIARNGELEATKALSILCTAVVFCWKCDTLPRWR